MLAEVHTSLRKSYNDLRVVAGNDVDPSGFTLLAILRNEMYFLPDFMAHYRGIGVERFVFLNDHSDDGSFEYLIQQPDTVVVESGRTYGDTIDVPTPVSDTIRNIRIIYLWRSLLHDLFAQNRWALQVDLDEFVHLRKGMRVQDLVMLLERQDARAVWGVMLDVYPKDIGALAEQEKTNRFDISATWYFDGERHLRLRQARIPRTVHPGARARLYHTYGVDRLYPVLKTKKGNKVIRRLGRSWFRPGPPKYNALQKPILVKWGGDCYFKSSHSVNLPASTDYLLPIQHFRFAGALYQKIRTGLRDGSYYNNSADHRLLSELLRTMEALNGSFLYRKSKPFDSFEDLARTGNALGL